MKTLIAIVCCPLVALIYVLGFLGKVFKFLVKEGFFGAVSYLIGYAMLVYVVVHFLTKYW